MDSKCSEGFRCNSRVKDSPWKQRTADHFDTRQEGEVAVGQKQVSKMELW